jgi:MoaA/NifB/PqqE/SkfB family radical SAM enzyme
MEKDLDLYVSNVCRNSCVFCVWRDRVPRGAPRFMPFPEVLRQLRDMYKAGCRRLTLSGGEPCLHPRLEEIAGWAKRIGYRVALSTDATDFAVPLFASRLAPLLDEVTVSVHGAEKAMVDGLAARPGRFAELGRALANLRAFGPAITIICNSVLCRSNYRRMPAIIRWTAGLCRPLKHVFSNPVPMGYSDAQYRELVVPLASLAKAVPAAVSAARKAGTGLSFFGIPACMLGPYWKFSEDFGWTSRTEVAPEPGKGGELRYEEYERVTAHSTRLHAKVCSGCAFRGWCPGVYRKYLELEGAGALKKVSRPPKPFEPPAVGND